MAIKTEISWKMKKGEQVRNKNENLILYVTVLSLHCKGGLLFNQLIMELISSKSIEQTSILYVASRDHVIIQNFIPAEFPNPFNLLKMCLFLEINK